MVRVTEHAGIDGLEQAVIPDAEEINGLGQTYVDSYVTARVVDATGKSVPGVRIIMVDITLNRPVAGGITGPDGTYTAKMVPARTVSVSPMRRPGLIFSPSHLIVTASMPTAMAKFTAMRA